MNREDLKDVIANRFSILCGGPREGSPCGCLGLRCGNTQCSQWWIFAFKGKEIFQKATDLYLNNQREIDEAVRQIILKRYII